MLSYSGSGIETTFTAGRGRLSRRAGADPAQRARDRGRSLLIVGALADVVEDQLRRLFDVAGYRARSVPAAAARADLPPVGPGTAFLLAQPFLADTARALEERGATRLAAPFPLGVRRHDRLAACGRGRSSGERMPPFRSRHRAWRERAQKRASRATATSSPASASSSSRIRSLKCRSRASCRANSAWTVEVGTPYLHRQLLAPELALLPPDALLSEGQDVERQLDRCRAARPDLVVCGLGLANPLEAEGLTTKWSIELLFTPIQGYEQAGDLAELFARPLVRRDPAGGLDDAAHALDIRRTARTSAPCGSRPP